jgi:hypothetical protein
LPVKQVTPVHVLHVLHVLHVALKKNGPSVAEEAKRTISAVFELAVSKVVGAQCKEFDLDAAVWRIPAVTEDRLADRFW